MYQTDEDLIELLLIPNVGRARAKALFSAGYHTLEDIAKAEPADILKIHGIGADIAASIVDYAREMERSKPKPAAAEPVSQILICPMCGSLVSAGSSVCNGCGIAFTDEVEELGGEGIIPEGGTKPEGDEFWYKEDKKLFICPECGSLVADGSHSCPNCGVGFEEEEDDATAPTAPGKDSDGFWYKERGRIFMCPNCGSFLKSDAESCGNCGIAFEAGVEEEEPGENVCPMCKNVLPADAKTCGGCGFDFSREGDADGFWYKGNGELLMCPNCGAFVPRSADNCSICGTKLEDAEEDEIAETAAEPFQCPMCKNTLPPGSETCNECGFDFSVEKDKDGFWYKDTTTLYLCPNCGGFISEAADRCQNCGTVLEGEEKAGIDETALGAQVGAVQKEPESAESTLEGDVDELIGLLHSESDTLLPQPAAEPTTQEPDLALADTHHEAILLCPVCGAFAQSGVTRCPACGAVFDDIEEIELELASADDVPVISKEELSKEMSAEIREIEAELMVSEKPQKAGTGVSKDFLDRWRKLDGVALAPPSEARGKLQPKLSQADIETELGLDGPSAPPDASVEALKPVAGGRSEKREDDWIAAAKKLAADGREDEAVASLDRAAEEDPERELEYKKLILEILGLGAAELQVDLSDIAAIDEIGNLQIDGADESRIEGIEAELASDPDNGELWQEKGEILERLGRHAEAVECFDRSISLTYSELRKDAKVSARRLSQIGIGMTNGQGRVNGRVNGLLTQRGMVNGRTNGLTNGKGRINGMINGLAGRVNGLTRGQGRTNGLVNGLGGLEAGMINGSSGLINGGVNGFINGGLVNGLGLVNGEGMVNGSGSLHRLRHRRRERIMWRYRLSAMSLLVTLVLMLSMLGNLMIEDTAGGISIDGNFADWEEAVPYSNFLRDIPTYPELRMLETRMEFDGERLDVYVRFEGDAFATPSDDAVNSVWIFADVDRNAETGYAIEGRGTDLVAEIYGWNGSIRGSNLHRFDNRANQNDWNGFLNIGSVRGACLGSTLEMEFIIPRDMPRTEGSPAVFVVSTDYLGNTDITDYFMFEGGGLVATARQLGADILEPAAAGSILCGVTLRAHSGGPGEFLALNFTVGGIDAQELLSPMLRMDGGASVPADVVSSGANVGFILRNGLLLEAGSAASFTFEAGIAQSADGKSLGISLGGASASQPVHVRNLGARTHNIGAPQRMTIDGAFGDWANIRGTPDPAGDAILIGGNSSVLSGNIDIADTKFTVAGQALFFYMSANGIMMGGADLPTLRHRPGSIPPVPERDSDRDSVPDSLDAYSLDFNNDGIPDSESMTGGNIPDLDADGIGDFPNGPDWWLNTTIPGDFPAPYGGISISVYIGPVGTHSEPKLGDDRAYVLIDSDDNPSTGRNLKGAYGVECVIAVTGKQNRIFASELYVDDPTINPTGWRFVGNVSAAVDWSRMEGAAPLSALGISPGENFTAYVSLEDWMGSTDTADQPFTAADDSYSKGTRSPAGDNVVINEISGFGSAEWIELCNPTGTALDMSYWTIQVQSGGIGAYKIVYTVPAGSTIGAFGSGSEYAIIDLTKQLADNKISTVRLVSGTATADEVMLPVPISGTTHARFKNATWGMPTDTDGVGDWYTSTASTPGAPNDRRTPIMSVAKSSDRAVVAQGGIVTYTIWYNNTGEGNAKHVWINDTLPASTDYASSSVPFTSYSGQQYRWYFSNVPPGVNIFTVSATVNSTTPLGATLTNNALLEYTDQLSRPQSPSSDSCDVTVIAARPIISLSKQADLAAPFPGETVTYTIAYNNIGAGTAGHVWINDTLPVGMTYVSGSAVPDYQSGQDVRWHFQDVAVGAHSLGFKASVGSAVAPGTVLTNSVTCDYKDASGASMPQEQAGVSVTVADSSSSIVINEVSSMPNPEWVELCNPSAEAVSIAYWAIQYYQGNWKSAHTFAPGTTIGAWGTGAEYLVVSLPAGSLPDQATSVRLVNSAGQVVDSTTYPKITVGQSWSRFKNEDTGKPDSGYYVTNSGWLVTEGPTPGAPNDRKRPIMTIDKSVSAEVAEPGQIITYTLWYSNTGDGNAKNVWVNDTLPAGVDFVSASPSPTSVSGQDLVWFFGNVIHDSVNSITLSVKMNELPTDGQTLTNTAGMVYHDALGRLMGTSTDSVSIACARPIISIEKVADSPTVLAGGTIVYTIFYNNTGSASAGSVWINDTLPMGVTFVSSSIAPDTVSGQTLGWHLTNVAPGPHSITVTVAVNSSANGTLTNWAWLDYSSAYGLGMEPSSDSATVIVPEMRGVVLPILGVMLIGLIAKKKRGKPDE
jgi:uncharacterized repeat protein (TIGR01451 family)